MLDEVGGVQYQHLSGYYTMDTAWPPLFYSYSWYASSYSSLLLAILVGLFSFLLIQAKKRR